MSSEDAVARQQLVAQFDDFFDGVFAPLERWLPRLQVQLAGRLEQGLLSGSQLSALIEADVLDVLDHSDRPLYGAGYCATGEVVSEGNPLAWWQGDERSLLASSTFGPGQAAIDLQRLEWFRVPAETGERHVAGPFVDYLCSNEITLTASLPVTLGGSFVGVMCADVLVATLEQLLLPLVARLPGSAFVNSSGRVLVASEPGYETGDRFVLDGEVTRSGRFPFALVSVPRSGQ